MKDIYWGKLSGFEKFIFVLGWLSAMNLAFWIVFMIMYATKQDKGKYFRFFNPHTYKVPYVFGWINFAILIIALLAVLFLLLVVLPVSVTRYA